MNRIHWILWVFALFLLQECGALKELSISPQPELEGMAGLEENCLGLDTIQSVLISKAEAILTFDNERYEVNLTIYSLKDSIIYLSAVNSGYEILRASVMKDSIKVINRLDKIVYISPLQRKFGYQYPVNFRDLQNLISDCYLCNDLYTAYDDHMDHIVFEFDERYVKKRIHLERLGLHLKTFEFYHQQTNKYLMGERIEDAFRIYSNFMITEFEIVARGGVTTYNRDIKIKMDVNPRRYTFTELR
jgi:hypothetical protein